MQPAIFKKLQRAAGGSNCSCSPSQRLLHSYDASGRSSAPEMVITATDTGQVARVLAECHRIGTPIVCRGAGSGLAGGAVPVAGGVVLDLAGMCSIKSIDPADQVAVVQPGVVTGELQAAAEAKGLIYPPDPASVGFCTVGGNIATNAGGLRAVKYGVTRDYVLSLEAVLADGTVMRSGAATFKGVVGYDLTRLLVGSEGTLAVFTEITLRLLPKPETVSTISASYIQLDRAVAGVQEVLASGIRPAALEFMDRTSIRVVDRYLDLGLSPETEAMLLIDLDGSLETVERQTEKIKTMLNRGGADQVQAANSAQSRKRLWSARRAVAPATFQLAPDKLGEDIVVPISKLGRMVSRLEEISQERGLPVISFGHAGDGNLHVNIMYDASDQEQSRAAQQAVSDVFAHTLALGGSISGEHGVGITKRGYAGAELDPAAVEMMRRIKAAFDPKNILNPHKKIPV